jgi:hypothetical protein
MALDALENKYMGLIVSDPSNGKNYTFLGFIMMAKGAADEKSKQICHLEMKKFIEQNARDFSEDLIDQYLVEYEEFHYCIEEDAKVWRKNGVRHRTTKKLVDGIMQTLPALVFNDGRMYWFVDGKKHRDDKDANGKALPAEIGRLAARAWRKNSEYFRDDVDEFGNLLPTEIYTCGSKFWYLNGRRHRAELGKNPNDKENFGKALPAVMFADGTKRWAFEGVDTTQAILTKKLTGCKIKTIACNKAAHIEVKMADGNVVKLSGKFAEVAVYERST